MYKVEKWMQSSASLAICWPNSQFEGKEILSKGQKNVSLFFLFVDKNILMAICHFFLYSMNTREILALFRILDSQDRYLAFQLKWPSFTKLILDYHLALSISKPKHFSSHILPHVQKLISPSDQCNQ